MIDQATELRKLVLRSLRDQPIVTGPPPRLIAMAGSGRGVGVTSLAVNLAVAMASQGTRVVLVDADVYSSDVAKLCGLDLTDADTQRNSSQHDIHELMCPGPLGLQVVPRLSAPFADDRASTDSELCDMSYERLHRQLATLGRHADVVVLDLGSGSGELVRRFSVTADEMLLVTTSGDTPVMEAYARIKTDLAMASQRSLRLVVNRVANEDQAADVHARIDGSCRKFLDTAIDLAGSVPDDEAAYRAFVSGQPFLLAETNARASQVVDEMAAMVLAVQLESRAA